MTTNELNALTEMNVYVTVLPLHYVCQYVICVCMCCYKNIILHASMYISLISIFIAERKSNKNIFLIFFCNFFVASRLLDLLQLLLHFVILAK